MMRNDHASILMPTTWAAEEDAAAENICRCNAEEQEYQRKRNDKREHGAEATFAWAGKQTNQAKQKTKRWPNEDADQCDYSEHNRVSAHGFIELFCHHFMGSFFLATPS